MAGEPRFVLSTRRAIIPTASDSMVPDHPATSCLKETLPTDLTHLHGFIEGMMERQDLEAMLSHMADDMILNTPLVPEPFRGKTAIRPVVVALMGVVDKFYFREIMQGPQHVAVSFGLTVGSAELDGMDYIRLDDAGLVQQMTVLWRPLPAIVAVLNRLNAAGGQPALELVPAGGG